MAKKSLKEKLDGINEYEREPVPKDKVKGFKSFVGMVAGEHIAGTEFVIGPMFVAYGVSASDLIWGLLIGNILAVLSWTADYFESDRLSGTNKYFSTLWNRSSSEKSVFYSLKSLTILLVFCFLHYLQSA